MSLPIFLAQTSQFSSSGDIPPAFWLCYGAFIIVAIAAIWRIFTKAGRPGWAAIIPIYNFIVLLDIVGKPWWWLLLFFIPFVNLIILIVVYMDLAKAFGQSTLFGIGLIVLSPIFMLILAFGPAEYVGPSN
jgi:hypothetical protein